MLEDLTPIREWQNVTREQFEQDIRPLGQPAILRGIERDWPLIRHGLESPREAVDFLVRLYTGKPVWTISLPAAERGRIFYNQEMRGYNFARSSQDMRNVLGALLANLDAAQPPGIAMQAVEAPEFLPGFDAVHPMALAPGIPAKLWISNATIVAPHHDLKENIACVAVGRRRFVLFPPEQLPNLYIGPIENTPAGAPVSMVSMTEPDFERYPRYRDALAAAQTAELAAGDAIYIPYMWWHGVLALERFNILVNYWWNETRDRSQVHPATALVAAWLAFMDMPEEQRRHWRGVFDHYVFRSDGHALEHLPPHARGVLGELDQRQIAAAKQTLGIAITG